LHEESQWIYRVYQRYTQVNAKHHFTVETNWSDQYEYPTRLNDSLTLSELKFCPRL